MIFAFKWRDLSLATFIIQQESRLIWFYAMKTFWFIIIMSIIPGG